MSRLKRHVIGILAAATVAAAGFAAPPPASAMSASCVVRHTLYDVYMATGDAFFALGNSQAGYWWYARAAGVIDGC